MLVGLQSFAEGLDLKGELLTQVHIHKIAFPPIDSPVIITEGEWLKSLKRYPFEVQSLPSASFNPDPAGRPSDPQQPMLRRDRDLRSPAADQNYGSRLLASLPVFPIEQRAVPEADKAHLAALKPPPTRPKRRSAATRFPASGGVNQSSGGRRRLTGVVFTIEVLLCACSASRSRVWSSCSIECATSRTIKQSSPVTLSHSTTSGIA